LTAAEPVADASSAAVPVAAVAAVRVADASSAAVPVAAVKAQSRFPLTIAPLWSPRRNRGALRPRGA
jgi:hypothetical protein